MAVVAIAVVVNDVRTILLFFFPCVQFLRVKMQNKCFVCLWLGIEMWKIWNIWPSAIFTDGWWWDYILLLSIVSPLTHYNTTQYTCSMLVCSVFLHRLLYVCYSIFIHPYGVLHSSLCIYIRQKKNYCRQHLLERDTNLIRFVSRNFNWFA